MSGIINKQEGFATRLGVLTATLGSAVGLGNIWKFPYMTGDGGGAAFLVVYLLATFLVGLPVMIGEIMLGREAKANAVGTWKKLAPGTPWFLVGAAGVLAAFLIMAFYTDVVGWVFSFIVRAATGELNAVDPKVGEAAFGAMVSNPWHSLYWQWGVLALVGLILVGGVSKGIEKTTKVLMPVLFIMLVGVCIRSLMLPKAPEGLAFLFRPDFSKVTVDVVLNAMGLAFFKLSIGMGTMMTYGSYFRDDADIPLTTMRVMLADLVVSLLAGIAIFPAVFNYGFEPTAGPGLLFMTMPAVFSSLPFGQFFMTVFFVLTGIATIGAMMSLFEVPVALLSGSGWMGRKQAVIATAIGLALFGIPATLSFSTLADVTIFGKNFFDLYDFLSSNIILPLGGICICLYCGWVWGISQSRKALSNSGSLSNSGLIDLWFMLVRYLTPVLVVLVLLKGLKVF
ncbi:sodium-dependent transporter [Desulfovibrio mangrovi]|uniref:sodium-dependent transporter n=1 Tax=Desulfovibrio mangrovi TaxID=2976983 RepID=UPI0022457A47|nr:sodium-dependent transporter [Desulfovibrio mangrovi]UZP67985.1 sodium-dependent transporter [Desulfovibrio mangrovi]